MKEQNEKQAIEEMAKVIDEFTDPLSARDIHKADFSEQFSEHLYNAGYRKQEWISVDERLPDKELRELRLRCKNPDKYYECIVYVQFETFGITCGAYYTDGKFKKDERSPMYHVTHWMPLPEAPKGGAE